MPRGGSRPGAGRPKGSRARVLPGLVGPDDDVGRVLKEVMESAENSPSLRVRAAAALSRHAKSLRQQIKRGAPGAAEPVYTPGPLGFLHTAGRTREEGLAALAKALGEKD